MQTILGFGGAIGNELLTALRSYTDKIRLVSRNSKSSHQGDEYVCADLRVDNDAKRAVEGSEIVYLIVGLEYNTKIWKKDWPVIMVNVINACVAHNSKLIFLDNIYMYHRRFLNSMNERSPVKPSTKKSRIRSEVVRILLGEMNLGTIKAAVARSADFYGPSIKKNSILTTTVFKRLAKRKIAIWIGNPKYSHSFTYTPDAARAIALLGNSEHAYGEVWHLPTAPDPPTGKEWIALIAREMGVGARYIWLPTFMVAFLGIFNRVMREMKEIMYQYNTEYIFDSSKFEKKFSFIPTPYIEGIQQIIKTDYKDISPK